MSVVYSEYDCSPIFGWYKDYSKGLNGKKVIKDGITEVIHGQ
jgi:hypothetical protein